MGKRTITFLIFLIFFALSGYAQQPEKRPVSLDLDSASVLPFLQQIEAQTSLHFYLDLKQFDSLRVSIHVKSQPVAAVLSGVFENSDYHFTFLDNKVFLTRGVTLRTELPATFFSGTGSDTSGQSASRELLLAGASKKAVVEDRLYEIGTKTKTISNARATFSGYVRNRKNGEPVSGAFLSVPNTNAGVTTDQYGYYSITIPRGSHTLLIQGIGMQESSRRIVLYTDGKFNIDLDERVTTLKEVIVSAAKLANIRRVPMGVERMNIQTIKQIPAAFGEADVLRAVLTLPGVKTVGEASTGFNVRGGSVDQNLILFNDATIFNPAHFFGFFSAFNPDVVKNVELYKSSIPAKYGGRLASVLNITSREGNKKTITGTAGVGLLTSRISLEGPIVKDKLSFIAAARGTYANWMLGLLPDEYGKSRAAFSDINLHLNYQPDNKNTINLTAYTSNDRFSLNSDTSYGYSNRNLSIKWKHSFNSKLSNEITTGYDHYEYSTESSKLPEFGYKLAFDISQFNGKADFSWYYHPKHTAEFGVGYIVYILNPGEYNPVGSKSLIKPDLVPAEHAQEMAAYISDRWSPTTNLSIQGGVRFSLFNYLGPASVNIYPAGAPRIIDNLLETINYPSGKNIQNYSGPEFRLSARYNLTNDFSLKAGYNSLRQYIHLLSNTTAISPTDIWKLSDKNIRPQYGDQVSFGIYKNLKGNTIETSVEIYYKNIKNYLDYKSGASLVMNHHIETDVMSTVGKAYGAEFMLKKQDGKLNGWFSYTWSRILLKQNDPGVAEIINGGRFYPSSYDKPHDATLVGNYRLSHRFSISMNATYNTGRPITLPIGRYYFAGAQRALYSDRNAYRIPDYFRMDMSMNIEGNHKVNQKTHNSWTVGVYNMTGRRNAYSVYYVTERGVINGYKLSIFGSIIPFVNYNIRF